MSAVVAAMLLTSVASVDDAASAQAKPVVYLTFDDGPGPSAPAFLDLLAGYNVPASFFVVDDRVGSNEDVVRQMIRSGHVVGNHSRGHVELTRLATSDVVRELTATTDAILTSTGLRVACYRPPYGDTNAAVHQAAVSVGLPNQDWEADGSHWGLWDIDTRDWQLYVPSSGGRRPTCCAS